MQKMCVSILVLFCVFTINTMNHFYRDGNPYSEGHRWYEQGEYAKALEVYDSKLPPYDSGIHETSKALNEAGICRAYALWAQGNLGNAFNELSRWMRSKPSSTPALKKPLDLNDINKAKDKTVLVRGVYGIGDTFLWSVFMRKLKKKTNCTLLFKPQKPVMTEFERAGYIDGCVSDDPNFDYDCYLPEIAVLLRVQTNDDIKRIISEDGPHLTAFVKEGSFYMREFWSNRLSELKKMHGFKIPIFLQHKSSSAPLPGGLELTRTIIFEILAGVAERVKGSKILSLQLKKEVSKSDFNEGDDYFQENNKYDWVKAKNSKNVLYLPQEFSNFDQYPFEDTFGILEAGIRDHGGYLLTVDTSGLHAAGGLYHGSDKAKKKILCLHKLVRAAQWGNRLSSDDPVMQENSLYPGVMDFRQTSKVDAQELAKQKGYDWQELEKNKERKKMRELKYLAQKESLDPVISAVCDYINK